MNSFTLLYLFYSAKLGSQASIYFIWLKDSSSGTIAFIAAAVAVFAIFPFFHVIVHVFSAKPLSNSTFIGYLCFSFLLAILWYEPTRDGEQRILPFALVTTVDLLTLLIFLFQRQIGHWHNILTSDIKQGHFRAGSIDDTFVCQGNEQVRHPNFGARPDIPRSKIRQIQEELVYDIDAVIHSGVDTIGSNHRSIAGQFDRSAAGGRGFGQRFDNGETSRRFAGAEVAMRGPSNVGWGTRMVQPVSEDQEIEQLQPTSESQEIEEVRTDLHLDQQERRQSGYFIDVGIEDVNSDSGSGIIYPPCPVGTPNTIYRDIHPALRPTFDNTSQPVSPDGSQTPKQAPSFTGTSVLELNKI